MKRVDNRQPWLNCRHYFEGIIL